MHVAGQLVCFASFKLFDGEIMGNTCTTFPSRLLLLFEKKWVMSERISTILNYPGINQQAVHM